MKVVFTPAAQADLRAIGAWIAQDDPIQAARFVTMLIDACTAIADLPHGYPTIGSGRHPLRRKNVKRYRIIFRALPGEVRIIAVTHGARDTGSIHD